MLQLLVALVALLSQSSKPDYSCLLHETSNLLYLLKLCLQFMFIFITCGKSVSANSGVVRRVCQNTAEWNFTVLMNYFFLEGGGGGIKA
jgi:hypothetical protein